MIANKHIPICLLASDIASNHLAAGFETDLRASPTIRIDTGINRVGKDPINHTIAWPPPLDYPPVLAVHNNRHFDAFVDQPKTHLADTADLCEFAESQIYRLAHPLVRIQFNAIIRAAYITNSNGPMQVTAWRFQSQCFNGALTQDGQLKLAECSFQTKQEPIVAELGIIDILLINDEAVYQGAELQQGMPFTAVTGKARALYCEHGTGYTGADRCQQAIESGSHSAVSGVTEIFINNDHILPTESLGTFHKGVLPTTALRIVDELPRGGLPHIDISCTIASFGTASTRLSPARTARSASCSCSWG
jgi:hypothetical protein